MSHAILPSLYPNPSHEQHRLAALARFDIASKPLQRDLEGLSRLAQILTNTPLALINIIGRDEQVTVCSVGVQLPPVARESSLCHHTVLKHDLLYLPDTLADPRFVDHPMVNGQLSAARMYAGAPLLTEDGQALGALCVADLVVHELSDAQLEALRELAAQVVSTLELHRHASLLARSYSDLEDFAGLVARDVHRPLVKAIDHTETLADYLLVGSPLTGETLRQLHGALTDTRNILDEVMGTTAAHNSPAHFAPHDLNLIADHAVDQVQHSLPHNPTRVFITRLPTVEVDEQMMLHLLRTLVTNAMLNVDAQQRPTVQISARESGRGWVIIVEDSGMGEEVCAGGEVSSGSLTRLRLLQPLLRRTARRTAQATPPSCRATSNRAWGWPSAGASSNGTTATCGLKTAPWEGSGCACTCPPLNPPRLPPLTSRLRLRSRCRPAPPRSPTMAEAPP